MKVEFLVSGNALVVNPTTPQVMGILRPHLQFMEVVRRSDKPAWKIRKDGEQLYTRQNVQMYLLDHRKRIATQYGLHQKLVQALRENGHEVSYLDFDPPKPEVYGLDWSRMKQFNIQFRDDSQRDCLIAMLAGRCGRIKCAPAFGKAQPLWAEVQTPHGPREMGDLIVGDVVFGANGRPTQVTGVYPQGVKKVYRITFRDGSVTHCCGEHLWEVRAPKLWRHKRPKVMSTQELISHREQAKGGLYFHVRLCGPLYYPFLPLPIPSYTLGALIGDGCFRGKSVGITSADAEVISQLQSEVPDGYVWRVIASDPIEWSCVRKKKRKAKNDLKRGLDDLGLWGLKSVDKFIPDAYLYNHEAERWDLLQGLMDTDGTVSKAGAASYSTVSPQLASDVARLVESLGGTALVARACRKSGNSYLVSVWFEDTARCFRLTRKKDRIRERTKFRFGRRIVSIEPAGDHECQCISVSNKDGLYLTDHCIVTHNTFLMGLTALLMPKARIDIVTKRVDILRNDVYPDLCQMLPDVGMVGGGNKSRTTHRVMCYTADSLHHSDFSADVVLVDECHEAAANEFCSRMLQYDHAHRYGFSASHERSDGRSPLLEALFGPIVFDQEYSEAVGRGLVAPIRVLWTPVDMSRNPAEGLYDAAKSRAAVWTNNHRNKLIVKDAREYGDDVQVLVTCDTIEHAMHLKRMMPDYTLVYADGGLDPVDRLTYIQQGFIPPNEPLIDLDRRKLLTAQFSAGQLKKVICTTVWNVGVDFPSLAVLIRADGSGSTVRSTQVPGRVARIHESKGVAEVRDYCDRFDQGCYQKACKRRKIYDSHGWEQLGWPESARASREHAYA